MPGAFLGRTRRRCCKETKFCPIVILESYINPLLEWDFRSKTFVQTICIRSKTFVQTFMCRSMTYAQRKTFVQTFWFQSIAFCSNILDWKQDFCSQILDLKRINKFGFEVRLWFKHFVVETRLLLTTFLDSKQNFWSNIWIQSKFFDQIFWLQTKTIVQSF